MQTHLFSRRPIVLSIQDIDSLTKDSPIALLNALYQCQDFVFVDSTHNPSLNDSNITKTFGYKSSFYLSFIANKDSLSNEYLQARKALYKTMINLREEREQEHKEEQDRISQLSYEEYKEEQKQKERQERFSSRNTTKNLRSTSNNAYNTKESNLILESKDKNNAIIFLDSANSLSNLIHIHNDKIDIFTKDYTRLDIQELESLVKEYQQRYTESNNTESSNQQSKLTLDSLHSSNTQIFLYSHLLTGGTESNKPYNECFFGTLDSKDSNLGLDTLKPIYHLIGETDYDTKDSKESFTQTLQIFLNGNTLTLLNYSLLDSSLNIKLECNSKESKAILERENKHKESKKTKNLKLNLPNPPLCSTQY